VLGVSLSGCGNSSIDGFQALDNREESVEKIGINITCTSPATLSDYIELKSADKLVKDESDRTIIRLYHDENNVKRVCLQSGKAHIERLNIE